MLILIFLALLLVGVPIAIVLGETAIAYIWLSDNPLLYLSFLQQLFSGLERYGLLAIPLFILTGELMNEGGITRRLIAVAGIFVGGLRGGLAYINLLANMMMASIIGSSTAQIAIMSKAMIPEMTRGGYSVEFAAATTAAGGLLSPIIPPSMLFVIFGVLAQVSIGDMFLAGIIPGVMMAAGFLLAIAALGLRHQYPKGEWYGGREVLQHFVDGIPAALVPIVMIGGITSGLATPTESAALGSVAAFVVGKFVYKDLLLSRLAEVFASTALTSAMVLFLVATANVFGWVIDGIAALILVVPLLLPVAVDSYGISPFHFGVIVCINIVLGLLTPPVGVGLFIVATVAKTSPGRVFMALLPFLLTTVFVLIVISYQPSLVTFFIE